MAIAGTDFVWRSRHLVIIGLTAIAIASIIRDGFSEPVTAIVGILTTIMGIDKYLVTRANAIEQSAATAAK